MSEREQPVISMGNDNNNNTFQLFGMSLQTAVLVGALLLNMGVQWSRSMETDALSRELAAKVQVLETKVAQQDTLIQTIVPRMEKIDGNIEKLTDSIIGLSGRIGSK
ncbi:hypothetical protein [Aeromonas salmonicida]|uniref:hypothetical protein n=1 Tax=Aeromonas salmonicida TaxID=645 RepID=UPI003F7BE468